VNSTNHIKDNVVFVLRKGEPEEPLMRVVDTKIIAVLEKANGEVEVHETKNIVTDDGDVYYAQRASGTTPTNFWTSGAFDGLMFLSQATTPPAKNQTYAALSSIQNTGGTAMISGYPKSNDSDTDNSGRGTKVVTYACSFSTGTTYTNVADVAIAKAGASGTSPILMRALFSSTFTKATTDTLKVFVNHTMTGT
jgi:hypothetical protein